MRKKALMTIVAASQVFLIAATSAADLEFKGTKIGQAFTETDRFSCENRKTSMGDAVCHLPYGHADSIAGQHADVVVYLLQAKVSAIYLKFSSDGYDAVKDALSAKYGAGKSKKTILQNGLGAVFENETTLWTRPDGILGAERYTGSVSSGSVIMQSIESLDTSRARRQEQEKQNANDL